MENENQKLEMPRYKSHKTVRALKIKEVVDKGTDTTTDENPIVEIHFEDSRFEPWTINLRGKPTPAAGWYLVKYEDGYISFSPAAQFENGNTLDAPLNSEAHHPANPLDLRSFSQQDIDNWFSYHTPTPEQIVQYGEIRTAAKIFAETINRHVPASADKTAAMRELRGCVMAANLAIACNTTSGGNFPQAGTGPAIDSTVPPHQRRVLVEKKELEEKLGKLRTFINSSTYYASMADTQEGREEQDRLLEQASLMDRYIAVLDERIAAF